MTYCEVLRTGRVRNALMPTGSLEARKIISDVHLLPNFRKVFTFLLWAVGSTVRRKPDVSGLMLVEWMDLKPWTFG